MYLHSACCNRTNVPAVQNTLPVTVAAAARSMHRPRVFATMGGFARPACARCLRAPTRRVFTTTHVFITRHVFTRPVFEKCLRASACVRRSVLWEVSSRAHVSSRRLGSSPDCLREVSSPAHVSSRRRASSPDLSSGRVFARPCVFATKRVFARPVFGKCFRPPTCLRNDACLRPTCLREASSPAHVSSRRRVPSPARVFAPRSVFAPM